MDMDVDAAPARADVVTGISTGALMSSFAFLGPEYDDQVREFYTTIRRQDVYRFRPIRGLFSIALAACATAKLRSTSARGTSAPWSIGSCTKCT